MKSFFSKLQSSRRQVHNGCQVSSSPPRNTSELKKCCPILTSTSTSTSCRHLSHSCIPSISIIVKDINYKNISLLQCRSLSYKKENISSREISNLQSAPSSDTDNQAKEGGKTENDNVDEELKFSRPFNYLGANPQPDPPEYQKKSEQTKYVSFLEAIPLTWRLYKSTWVGFFANHGRKDEKDSDDENDDQYVINQQEIDRRQKELRKNIGRNVKVLKEEGTHAVEAVKELTGIRSKKNLVEWSMEQLKLANECVGEFMSGYRKGRDQEVAKMMNEYFKDFEVNEGIIDEEKGKGNIMKAGRRRRRRKSKW